MKQLFSVQGMTCGHCEKAVRDAITTLDPSAIVQIDRSSGSVEVETHVPSTQVMQAVREEGYQVVQA